jgi:hypothetical protein
VGSLFGVPNDPTNDAMVRVYEAYVERWGEQLQSFVDGDTDRRRPYGARERAYTRRKLSRGSDDVYSHATGGDLDHASVWQVELRLKRSESRHMSAMWWSVAPGTDPRELREFFLAAAGSGRFLHGYGGCAVVLPISRTAQRMSQKTQITLAKRFAGLDVLGVTDTALNAHDGIKCVNWLTLVDDTLLERIGGRASVRASVSSRIECHDTDNGLILQAGPRPVSGDVNRPDELGDYREVAAALKAIYSTGSYYNSFTYLDGLVDQDPTPSVSYVDAWRKRFFPGAKWP